MRVMRLYQISLQAEIHQHLQTLHNTCEGYFCSENLKIIIISLLIHSITDAGLAKENPADLRIQEMM
jgi:hypothetical protein